MIRRRLCKLGCGQSIQLLRTAASSGKKWMPLDTEPHPHGSVAIDAHMRAVVVGIDHPLHRGELYRPHFESCEVHRRRLRDDAQIRLDVDG